METNAHITKADLVEFQLFQLLRRADGRYQRIAFAVLPPILIIAGLFALIASRFPGPVPVANTLLPLLLVVPLYLLLLYRLTKRRLARQLDVWLKTPENQKMLGDHLITLTEDGLTVVQGSEPQVWRWEQILRVIANNNYGYIYTGPDQALIIPQRCFPDDSAFHTYVKFAVIHHWNKQRAAAALASAMDAEASKGH